MNQATPMHRLYRSRRDRKVAGVAGGLADYLGADPTIVRVLWIVAGVTTGPAALVAYALCAAIIPKEPADAAGV